MVHVFERLWLQERLLRPLSLPRPATTRAWCFQRGLFGARSIVLRTSLTLDM